MKLKFIATIGACVLLFSDLSVAQRGIAKVQDAARADSLRAKYDESDQAIIECSSKYSFSYESRSDFKVKAEMDYKESIIAIRDESTYYKSILYDEKSELSRIKAYGNRNKPYLIYPAFEDYQSGEYFYSDAQICKFTMSFSSRGDKLRYQYTKSYEDVKYLTKATFHSHHPVLKSVLEFTIPNWLDVELKEMNFDGFEIEKVVEPNARMKNTVYRYTMENLDPVKSESSAPSFSKQFPHLLLLFKGYDRDNRVTKLFGSTEDLYEWYRSLTTQLENKKEELKPTVDKLTADAKTDEDKIKAIFYWVQDNIRYIAFEDGIMGFKPDEAENVFKKKYGDCKGMANLTKNMLEIAGFDARLTWIGTRSIPYDYSIPSLVVDNHMICTVILNDKKFFLDATEEYVGYGDYAYRIQGRPVMIENGDKFELDKVPEFGHDHNKTIHILNLSIHDATLKGYAGIKYVGESKIGILRQYSYIQTQNKENAIKEFLSDGDKNVSVSEISTSDFSKREIPLEMKYDLSWSNQITAVGNEMYVNVTMDREYLNSEVDKDRFSDFEFPYKVDIEGKTTLKVPTGYKVDYLPEAVLVASEDFVFNLKFSLVGDTISYTKEIIIGNAILRKKDFDEWNKAIKKLRAFYKDQIVLVKN
ncbi:MAG: transglutaminase domain-containing protein [Flavobacteriales bacterium]|nr:transglutaminase domain-containing protein [Flavobacteriales bacterium]